MKSRAGGQWDSPGGRTKGRQCIETEVRQRSLCGGQSWLDEEYFYQLQSFAGSWFNEVRRTLDSSGAC